MTSDSSKNGARLLDGIRGPADVKAIREQDLPQLALEVREELIKVLSQTGGHLGPNLGVVELTIALHRVFKTPKDRFVFAVSHQGYVHKMFTGRLDRIATMRQYQGLNGFLLRTESDHDCYGAGHAGTALSAGLGMAVGRDLRGGDENVVVVAGDAAFTCGISYEALNNARSQTRRFIVVLNDNEWSIAKNVGAIANYLNNIVANPTYAGLHDKARRFVEAIAGRIAVEFAHKVEEGVKNLLVPSVIFEELGLRYYGPIDGHDIPLLIKTFDFPRGRAEPVLLTILTKKGKGYEPAIAKPDKFHGLGKYKIESGETAPAPTPTYSELMGKTLAKFADSNQKIVAITAAMPSGTGLGFFQAQHPTRYFDVGIAEEHAALFACGLATQGLKPFLTIYSTFMQRAYDMIIHDIALQNLNVALCMDRAGLSGDDGPTHHGLFEIGKAEVVQHGRDVAIFGLGNMFEVAEEAARKLEEKGISVALINPRWIKPLDTGTLEFFARSVEVICTIEDHVLHNGFGCAVMEHLYSQGIHTPTVRIGWPDEFIEHGSVPILRQKHGITADALVEKVLPLLRKKPAAKSSAA